MLAVHHDSGVHSLASDSLSIYWGSSGPGQMQATLVRLVIPSMNLLILYVVIVTSRIQISLRRSLPLLHSFSAASDDITLLLSSQVLAMFCLLACLGNNTRV